MTLWVILVKEPVSRRGMEAWSMEQGARSMLGAKRRGDGQREDWQKAKPAAVVPQAAKRRTLRPFAINPFLTQIIKLNGITLIPNLRQ
jgi:hypothetical protein